MLSHKMAILEVIFVDTSVVTISQMCHYSSKPMKQTY